MTLATIHEYGSTTLNLLANDTDPNSADTLAVASVDTAVTTGTVTLNGDGTVTYDPNGQFVTLAIGETATDTFSYTIDDGNGGTATANVTITGLDAPPPLESDLAVTVGGTSFVSGANSIDFGTLALGDATSRLIQITNNDEGELTLDAASLILPAGWEAVIAFDETVAVDGQTFLALKFVGSDIGNFSGTVSFTTNDPDTAICLSLM